MQIQQLYGTLLSGNQYAMRHLLLQFPTLVNTKDATGMTIINYYIASCSNKLVVKNIDILLDLLQCGAKQQNLHNALHNELLHAHRQQFWWVVMLLFDYGFRLPQESIALQVHIIQTAVQHSRMYFNQINSLYMAQHRQLRDIDAVLISIMFAFVNNYRIELDTLKPPRRLLQAAMTLCNLKKTQ
tara:strand:- start:160 stop:714 length:555 start_codon:yes stop_codon:yes gene_type:complete